MTEVITAYGGNGMTAPVVADQTIPVNRLLNINLTPTGGTGPYTLELYSGTLPSGLKLMSGSSPYLYGKIATKGTYTFSILISETGNGKVTTRAFTITVEDFTVLGGQASAFTISPTAGVSKTYQLATSPAETGVVWSVSSGDLSNVTATLAPATGLVTINHSSAASEAVVFTATRSDGTRAKTGVVTIDVQAALAVADPTPKIKVDNSFSLALNPTGGVEPYSYSYTGTIPDDVFWDETKGLLLGQPGTAGTVNATFTVTDANGATDSTSSTAFAVVDTQNEDILAAVGNSHPVDLTTGNFHYTTVDLGSSTGACTITFTVPSGPDGGSLLVKQHGTTARDITWAVSAGTFEWAGTEPTWSGDTAASYRAIAWRYDGSVMRLAATEEFA